MTLLIAVVAPEYGLSVSDQRVTATFGSRVRTIDERFNKHIHFGTEEYVGVMTYTGVAQWHAGGKQQRLYDLITGAIVDLIPSRPKLAALMKHIIEQLHERMPDATTLGIEPDFELHAVTRAQGYPINTITVISTFRRSPPWGAEDGMIYRWDLGRITIFMKALIEETDVVFGGVESYVSALEKTRVREAVRSGADAFQVSRMASRIVEAVSNRTPLVGPSSVAIVVPANGYVDTNLWRRTTEGVMAFLPRTIFPNGVVSGPSTFPVDLSLISDGQLPKHSLFFKAIVANEYKRRDRRRIFRHRKGPLIPGIFGLLGLVLFGQVQEGYDDFGFGHGDID